MMPDIIEAQQHPTKSAKIGIWKINLHNNQIFWDATTRSILEVNDYFDPNTNNGFDFFIATPYKELFQERLTSAIHNGISFSEKFKMITAQNTIKYIECQCVVEIDMGKSVNLLGTFIEYPAPNNLFRNPGFAINQISIDLSNYADPAILFDKITGKIIDCNTKAESLTEYNRKELCDMYKSQLFSEELQKKSFNTITNRFNSTGIVKSETYLIKKSGDRFPVTIIVDNKAISRKETLSVCTLKLNTQRKTPSLPSTIIKFATSKIDEIIVIADQNGTALWANDAYSVITGAKTDEIIGMEISSLFTCIDNKDSAYSALNQAIKSKKDVKITITNYSKNGERYWLELELSKTNDFYTNDSYFILTAKNRTEIKLYDTKLQNLLETISTQNNRLYNFTHIVSHNIRSHTSNLSMVVDILENTTDINEKLSYFSLFKEASEKLSQSIEYLNEIITIQQNTNRERKSVNLKDEIERVKFELEVVIKENNITITDTIPNNVMISVVPVYFESILLNIITNAMKYKSLDRKATLEIGHQIIDNYNVINFKDNGLGLDLDKNGHKIFGMYKTFHGNDDARGIGLFITKNQLEAMKGKIEVESKVNVGSNFKIYLNEK